MAEQESGVIFTQDGVPVEGSADYQKVLDSRWRFVELEVEEEVKVSLPAQSAVTFANRYFEKTTVLTHGLGFIPLFETDLDDAAITDGIWADKDRVFVRRLISTGGAAAAGPVTFHIRVYNLPILEEYAAPKEFVVGSSSPEGSVGMQFLEESGGVDLGDVSPVGFSVDTRKKILSVHRTGLALINDYVGRQARCSAIDTATDILTITNQPGAPYGTSFAWTSTVGQAVTLSPADFVTYPGGLGAGTYYLIPQDSTHVKLAGSYSDALAGTAINITSAGSLPMMLSAAANPNLRENSIYHNVGYPPTFVLAETNFDDAFFNAPETETYIGPIMENPPTRMTADGDYINFFGVQSIFTGRYGYVILKDPVELAK